MAEDDPDGRLNPLIDLISILVKLTGGKYAVK